jgi:hypothetical protein
MWKYLILLILTFDFGKSTMAIQFLNDELKTVEKTLKDFEYHLFMK